MPVQIDDVRAELVSATKPEGAGSNKAAKPEPDWRLLIERSLQRARRLRAD